MTGQSPTEDLEVLLRFLASTDLAGSTHERIPTPLDDVVFDRLIMRARVSRLLGLLAVNVDSGRLPATERQRRTAYEHAASAVRGDLERESTLLETASWLDQAHLPFRVLKGPAIAHLDEIDPVRRSYGDIDLLLPGDHFTDAVSLLAEHRYVRTFPEPRPGFDGRFSKGACLRRDTEELDLHRTLAPGPFGMSIDVSDLWSASDALVVDGVELRALPAELRLLHSAYHAVLGRSSPKLVALRDMALLAARPDVDVQRVVWLAVRWDGTAVLRWALTAAEATLGIELRELRSQLPQEPDPRRQRRRLRSYAGGPDRYARQALASVTAVRGWGDRTRYVRALLLPQRSYVQGRRHRGRLGRLFRAAASVPPRRRP